VRDTLWHSPVCDSSPSPQSVSLALSLCSQVAPPEWPSTIVGADAKPPPGPAPVATASGEIDPDVMREVLLDDAVEGVEAWFVRTFGAVSEREPPSEDPIAEYHRWRSSNGFDTPTPLGDGTDMDEAVATLVSNDPLGDLRRRVDEAGSTLPGADRGSDLRRP
jgi:hypothetical protein